MDWSYCADPPLAWIQLRDTLLKLFFTPWLSLPLVVLVWFPFSRLLCKRSRPRVLSLAFLVALISVIYTPLSTALFTGLLVRLIPASTVFSTSTAVLLGRGPEIGNASAAMAAVLLQQDLAQKIYISGDTVSSTAPLLSLGVPATAIAGDSCAQTTAENAQVTSRWLHRHGIRSIVLLTDKWQLARATRLFSREGILVQPLIVPVQLSSSQANRLALREFWAYGLYWLQGRL